MTEGWFHGSYLILFEDQAPAFDCAYGVSAALPGYRLVGLRSWDDFLVLDSTGACFTIPTVPLLREYLAPFALPASLTNLEPDAELQGRIKWYVQPLLFGGDPQLGDNVSWVTIQKHAELVTWWNQKYRDLKDSAG